MRTKVALIGVVVAVAAATPALAKDRVGYHAIAAGSLTEAERRIEAERAIFPERPELMLNLAAVYARTGRDVQARALYGEVLNRDAVAMDMADGSVQSSHTLAQRGLTRLSATVASR